MPTKLSAEWETVFEEFHKQRNKQTIKVPQLKPVFNLNGPNNSGKQQIVLKVPEMVEKTGVKEFKTCTFTETPDKQYVITLSRSAHQKKFSSFVSAIFELTGGATSSKTWADRWNELQSHEKTETNQMAGKRRNLSFHEMTQPNPKQPKYSENFFLYAFERNSYRCMNQIPLTDVSAAGITCDGGELLLVDRNLRGIRLFSADREMQRIGDRQFPHCDYPYAICVARRQIWLTDKRSSPNGKICTLPRIQGQNVQIIENGGNLNEPSGIAAAAVALLICGKQHIFIVPLAGPGIPLAINPFFEFPDTSILTDIAYSQVAGLFFVCDSGNNCIWTASDKEIQKLNISSNPTIQHKLNSPTGICIYSQNVTEVKLLVSDMDCILELTVSIPSTNSGRPMEIVPTNCIRRSGICFSKICTNGENIFAIGMQPSKPPPTDTISQQQQCVNETPPDASFQQWFNEIELEMNRFLSLTPSEVNGDDVADILRNILKLFRFITTCPEQQSELFKRVTTMLAVAHNWLHNPQTEAQWNINPTTKAMLIKCLKLFTKDMKSKFLPEEDDYAVNVSNNGQQEPKIGDIVAVDYESMSFNSTLRNCCTTLGVVSWRYNMLFGGESPGSFQTPVAVWGMVFVRVCANSASKKLVTYDKNCFVVKNMNIMDGVGELMTLDELLTLDSNYQIVGTCRKKDNELILYQNKHEIPEDFQLEWEDGIIYTVIDLPPMLDAHVDFFLNSIHAFNDPLDCDYSKTFKQDTDTAPLDFDQFLNPILSHGPHLTAKRNKNIMPIINAPLTAYPIREITEMPVNDLRQRRITDGTNDGLKIRENNAEQFEPVDENIPIPRYKPSNHFEDKEKEKEHVYITFGVGGRSGCGKTTFAKEVLGIENIDDEKRTTGIVIHKKCIETNSTVYHLTFIDSPGIGDDATAEQTLVPLILEMKRRYKACARGDTSYDNAPVLWIFYLISDRRLTGNDKRCIRLLSKYTSIIPLIAKAETYQKHEILSYQEEVHKEIANMNVNILKIPVHNNFKDSYPYKWMYPYPIMGKTRNYHWTKGILAEVNDPNISSTVMLKYSLFSKADEENNFHCRILALPEGYKGTNTICNIYAKRFRSPHSYFSYRAWRDEFEIYYLQYSMIIVLLVLLIIFIALIGIILMLTGQL